MTYDESQRRITVGLSGTVSVRTQRIKNPDRLVIDLSEARLPLGQPIPIVQPKSSRIRSIRMGQNSYVPPVVRLVVDLMPGFEPMVTINQSSGKLMITLANPRPPQGERDLESLPGYPGASAEPAYPGMPVTSAPTPPVALPNPPSRPPVALKPAAGASQPPTPSPTPKPAAATPKPLWTPPPVPGWAPRPTPTSVPGEPLSGPPVSGSPVSGPPVVPLPNPLPPAAPTDTPVVIIPDDVRPVGSRPASPQPPVDPFSSRPADPFGRTPLPSAPTQGATRQPPTENVGKPASEDAPDTPPAESVIPEARRSSNPFGSSFQLRWQQVETLEEYGGPAPTFAYPAGINGFDLEHWFFPNLGAGFDARILYYDLSVESVRQHRTDASMGTYLALRYPLFGFLEPSLRAGYMGRSVTVESESTGTTFPFSPLQTYYGPTVSGKLKVSLLPGFSLDLHGKLLPSTQGSLYPGFPSVHPLSGRGWGANLVTDLMQGYVSLGYATEQLANADGSFKQTFGGITLGMGFRY